jgi:hypothetical protein
MARTRSLRSPFRVAIRSSLPCPLVQLDMYMYMCDDWPMKDTRLIALIEPSQMRALKALAKRQKTSLAEVVRQALTAHLAKEKP